MLGVRVPLRQQPRSHRGEMGSDVSLGEVAPLSGLIVVDEKLEKTVGRRRTLRKTVLVFKSRLFKNWSLAQLAEQHVLSVKVWGSTP